MTEHALDDDTPLEAVPLEELLDQALQPADPAVEGIEGPPTDEEAD